eukprot:4148566-Pyramimonas_sp.AAC.1
MRVAAVARTSSFSNALKVRPRRGRLLHRAPEHALAQRDCNRAVPGHEPLHRVEHPRTGIRIAPPDLLGAP